MGKGDKSGDAYKLTGKNKYAIVIGTMDKHRWQGLLIMLYINLEPGKNPICQPHQEGSRQRMSLSSLMVDDALMASIDAVGA